MEYKLLSIYLHYSVIILKQTQCTTKSIAWQGFHGHFRLFGVVSYLHIFAAFAVIFRFSLEDVPILDDTLHEMVMQSIDDCNISPLSGKC